MTTLSSLKRYSKRDAQRLLSSVTLSLLPHPEPSGVSGTKEDEDVERRVLEESRQKLNLGLDDESQEARTRLLEFLGDEISSSVLNGANINSIKDRLVERGDLSPSQYELHLEPQFKEFINLSGIDEALALDTLVHPDSVEHIPSDKYPDGSLGGTSIYLRNFGRGEGRYALLILSMNRGVHQYPVTAWRVFLSDVNLRLAQTPLDVLMAFVNSYGLEFQLNGKPPTKFIQRDVLMVPPHLKEGTRVPLSNFLKEPEVAGAVFRHQQTRYSVLGFLAFEFVFYLESSRYASDLRKHGIVADWKTEVSEIRAANPTSA